MAFQPITHVDGRQYDMMIPDKVEIESGPLIEVTFTDDDGTAFMASLFTRHAVDLVKDLAQALADQAPRKNTNVYPNHDPDNQDCPRNISYMQGVQECECEEGND